VSIKESALKVAAIDTLEKRIAQAKAEARAELMAELLAMHEAAGVKSVDVVLPDGRKVGGVSLTEPKGGIVIADRSAFDAWVAETYPNEVEMVTTTRVKPEFEKALLANAVVLSGGTILQGGENVMSPDGEEIPGAEYRAGGAPTTFSLRSVDREAIAEAFTRGELEHVVPLALPKGELD
jgi:hypothetical protein